ncbi:MULTISPECIES: T9SS type A sorting domain-containing protein [unclassified Parabacteroides]|uniref:T9SS type A sorting domain-containing protein n=1 Tax=unclassified Parabacteroides TaxID=2649774 RepID=UPI002473D1BB|nr:MULTISPECIES: T9SS type A sorting domain-containing protein [unclassified Parabacteroides]
MRRKGLLFLFFASCVILSSKAQVSHGGKPLPYTPTRSQSFNFYQEMPSFDVEEELRTDAMNESDLKSGYRFAYKFMTNYSPANTGETFIQQDGTKIWRMGIYSKGALSINVLFTEYELPEGAQLFLYNPEQTQILGSFTHLNNSDKQILPVSPIHGERLIVEYQEPANAAFPGRLTIGEVNHGYRSLRGYEPGGNRSEFACMLPPVCFDDEYNKVSRSVVLITIDGVTACSGVMLNNTQNDGKPYLLTASHCLNKNFSVSNPDYESIAGSIVCFFNYTSPTCNPVMRGTEEMSVASTIYRAVNEKIDMALLELQEAPPVYYQPYYAGWSIEEDGGTLPYAGIHHPRASVKRINISEDNVSLKSFTIKEISFYNNAHWKVDVWSSGSTASGSSGSPLFDSNNRVIGALSGGSSSCSVPMDDFYYALFKAWEPEDSPDKQLKHWLAPSNSKKLTIKGLDPYSTQPGYRLSNIYDLKRQDSITISELSSPATGYLFGSNSLKTTEYAEAYQVNEKAKIYGAYFVTPAVTDPVGSLNVEVVVYSGTDKPETLLYTGTFKPTYTEMSVIDSTFQETEKWLNRNQESFIRFDKPVEVSGTFYIGYRINSPENSTFAVYNLPKGQTSRNTSWINNKGEWIKASSHPSMPFNTSLFIDPVIRYTHLVTNEKPPVEDDVKVFINRNHKTVYVLLPEDIQKADMAIYSTNGQRMFQTTLSGNASTIPVSNLGSGIYIININGKNLYYSQKILF